MALEGSIQAALGQVNAIKEQVIIRGYTEQNNKKKDNSIRPIKGMRVWPLEAMELTIVSNSADDIAGGSGAGLVSVRGLDGNCDPVNLIVHMAGKTPVVTTGFKFIRVNDIFVVSSPTNVGKITVTHPEGLVEIMLPGDGYLSSCSYTVPKEFTLLISKATMSARDRGSFTIWSRLRSESQFDENLLIDGAWGRVFKYYYDKNGPFSELYTSYVVVPERSDIEITWRPEAKNKPASASLHGIVTDRLISPAIVGPISFLNPS